MTTTTKKKPRALRLELGLTAQSLSSQLRKQGWRWDMPEEGKMLQKDADAIYRLQIRGVLFLSVAEKAYREIINRVRKAVVEIPKKGAKLT